MEKKKVLKIFITIILVSVLLLGIYGGEMPGTVEIWTMEGIIRR